MPIKPPLLAHLGRNVYRASTPRLRTFSVYRPLHSTTSASIIASSFLSKFQSIGPQTRSQILDANQIHLLSLTLNRPSSNPTPPISNSPLPPGYHLVYFTPGFPEFELGADGTDASYNPEAPFTRRMWAGGEVRWPRDARGNANPLRVGQEVRETTRVLSAEPKVVRKTGEEMIVVGVEKEFENEFGVAVVDRRNWVFRKALPISSSSTPSTTTPTPTPPSKTNYSGPASSSTISTGTTHTRTLKQTAVTLFRFSALTFNPHRIHYDVPWARDVEGHRDIVVHGPLNLISILDLWRDTRNTKNDGDGDPALIFPESISYRATSPLYAEDTYKIVLEEEEGRLGHVQIFTPEGTIAMKAEIISA